MHIFETRYKFMQENSILYLIKPLQIASVIDHNDILQQRGSILIIPFPLVLWIEPMKLKYLEHTCFYLLKCFVML